MEKRHGLDPPCRFSVDPPPNTPYNIIMTTTNNGANEMTTPSIGDRFYANSGHPTELDDCLGTVTDIRRAHPTLDIGNVIEVEFDSGRTDTIGCRYTGSVDVVDGTVYTIAGAGIGNYRVRSELV